MTDIRLKQLLAAEMPPVPESFHLAVTGTLNRIVAEESQTTEKVRRLPPMRRVLLVAALIVLALATAAMAAVHWQIFDGLWPFAGIPGGADTVMRGHLAQTTVNNVEITVEEAGYDGRSLLLVYSYRLLDADTLTTPEKLHERGVGWWIDHIWFNGKAMDMPANSYGSTHMDPQTGKLTEKWVYRLDNEHVQLSGPTEIALPIGQRQPLEDYSRLHHPERYDENGTLLLPEAGMVSFTLDTTRHRQLEITAPNQPIHLDGFTAAVSEAAFSPLMTYITLRLEVSPEAVAAYREANGEGFFDEQGNLIYAYDGSELVAPWVLGLELVDGTGKVVAHQGGNNGYGANWAEFIYPATEVLPKELWLAPVAGEQADMSRAVRVR